MDSGLSLSPVVGRSNSETIEPLLSQPGQSTHGYFANAHHFQIHGSQQFYDIHGGIHHHMEKTGNRPARRYHTTYAETEIYPELDKLQPFISDGAFHDSKARFPPPRCHPGTRVEVLNMITEWIRDPDPCQRIFWLNGPAGAGKSAIAQTVAEHCKDKELAASFFFQRNTADRGFADCLFPTLAWQLATSIPEIRPYIESTLKAEHLLHTKSIDVQFDRLFVNIFETLRRNEPGLRPQKSLIIIDAVDECDIDQDQKTLLMLIGKLASQGIPLRFLICSRPEPQIQETFDLDMKQITRVLLLDGAFGPNNDIRKYLEDEFSRIFLDRKISPPPYQADIIHRLVVEASGQFIYASTIVKFMDDKDRNPRKQLELLSKPRRTKSTSPYTQLDQLYIQILSQQQNVRLLRDLFVLIIAFGQVDFSFICRRLRISKEDLELEIRRMHSLLNISDSGVEAYHLSLRDFFQDNKRAGKYYIHPVRVKLVLLPRNIRRSMRRNMTVLFIIGASMIITMVGIIGATSRLKATSQKAGIVIGLTIGSEVAFVVLTIILANIHARKLAMSRKWLEQATQP